MRNRLIESRTRLLSQAAVVVALAGTAAGCSGGVDRFNDPLFTGSTANQREIMSSAGGAMPSVSPGGGEAAVAHSDLPPPAGAPPAYGAAPPVVAAAAPPPAVPVAAGGNYGWSAAGGEVITVGPGQSLETLSIKYGGPVAEIAKANQIHSPADIHAGKVLVIPVRVAAEPAAAAPAHIAKVMPAAAAAPGAMAKVKAGDTIHVVESGQTLYSISRQYGVRVEDIVALNDLKPGQDIRTGEKLRIPAGGGAAGAVQAVAYAPDRPPEMLGAPPRPLGRLVIKGGKPVEALGESPVASAAPPPLPPSPPVPAAPVKPVPLHHGPAAPAVADVPKVAPAAPVVAEVPKAAPAASPPPASPAAASPPAAAAPVVPASAVADASADPPSANGTTFRWPVRGRIISAFGAKPNGEKNDGINLAVPEGTSVKAAEAGTVIYAGNELAGYGNLVLIRHADGWVSAYAHNSDLLVKRGDQVRRGQIIAHAGMTGSVNAPQVHFELRRGAKPVNPLDFLAGA